jgi:hypothetical protein
MSSRTAKFASAIFVALIAGVPLVTASHGAPAEADKCLSGPKGAPPAGGHWYYRVDRATKRACWYVGDAKEKTARAAPETSPPAADSASPPNSPDTPSSIANARAEWPVPQSRVGQDTSVFTAPRPLATVAGAISQENDQRANAGDTGAQRSVVGSRWGELAGSSTPASPEPPADNSTPANSGAAPTASRTPLPLAAADATSTEKPTGSVQMLLVAILGALALAGLLASAIFRLGGPRRNSSRGDRRVNWDSVRTDRPSLSDEARASRSMRELDLLPQGSLPRELRAADDPDQRIAHMLSRPARRAAT